MSVTSRLFGREMIADPYPVYHRLRSSAPVLWVEPLQASLLLRFDSPVQFTARIAKEDVELGGQPISAGQPVMCIPGAANRDPAQFPDPDRLDVGREDFRHVAFGLGPHYCLGAPLARLEGAVAFSTLLRRFPDLHLAAGRPPEYRDNFNLRGLTELRVEFSVSR
jgi:cytochrome P450